MIVLLQFVVHHRAVFAVDHEHCLLDLNALDFVGEDGKWIEAKLLEISKPLRVDDTRIAICGKIKRLALDEKSLFQLRKHDNTADWRLRGGHQQPVVAASVQPDNGRRSKAAESVGFKPLFAESGIHVTARLFAKLNHECPPPCIFLLSVRRSPSPKVTKERARSSPAVLVYATSQKTLIAPFGEVSFWNNSV